MTDEIDVTLIIDGTLPDALDAQLPPYPEPIADALTRVLCAGQSAAANATMMVQLTALVRERIEFFLARQQAVN